MAASVEELIAELRAEEEAQEEAQEEQGGGDGVYLIMQGHPPITTVSRGGGGGGAGNPGYRGDPHTTTEHFYSEIPPPPPMEPCPPTYNTKGHPLSTTSRTSTPRNPYGYSGSSHYGGKPGGVGKMDELDLDLYSRMKDPLCLCTRQVTIHVTVMVVTGALYLVIGGLAGFYIGRSCEYILWAGRGREG